ncbi:MAG TPA: HepT-like ribonuclease domain-containing protein, partial [Pseudogracilibacillus sp.]|nr:HepT-like ribonuclease domain-containing protein [Pseudogracilibacillus sp.]
MYFVDRSRIEKTLAYMEDVLNELKNVRISSFSEKLGLERIVHVLIESVLDVGNMMIDGFIMRDPGSYEDIIDILVDEEVIPAEDEADY